jgi:hypothetical protein
MEMELPFCDFWVAELADGDFVVLLYKNVPALLSLFFFMNLNYVFFFSFSGIMLTSLLGEFLLGDSVCGSSIVNWGPIQSYNFLIFHVLARLNETLFWVCLFLKI